MKIEDLEVNSNFDELKVRILSIQGPRPVDIRGRKTAVWDVLVRDEESSVVLTLWGWDAGKEYSVGDVISIRNGWCKSYQGNKQISLGREGKIFKESDDPNIPKSIDKPDF